MTRASDTARLLGAGGTLANDVTISEGSPSIKLNDTDTSRFIDILYGTRNATFRNTMASGEDMDTVAPEIIFSTKDDGETREHFRMNKSEAVFNEGSVDLDFRVESNGNANMLFVDGGNDKIGIGLNSPGTSLHIRSSTASNIAGYRDGTTGLIVEGDAASYIQLVASKTNPMAILFDGGDTHNDTARGGLIYDIDTGLSIKSGGSTRWTINETGNLLPSATSLGVYLGVTSATASNLLDDYEEGTWTPVLTDGSTTLTLNIATGLYRKIGTVVHAEFYIQRNDSANNTGVMLIQGLPFAHTALPAVVGQVWIDNSSSDIRCMLYLPTNYQQLYFVKTGASSSYVSLNEFDNSRYQYAAFTYISQ